MMLSKTDKKEVTIGAAQANIYALVFVLPVLLLFGLPYLLLWYDTFSFHDISTALKTYKLWAMLSPLVLMLVMLAGVVLHELIHGLSWALFCKNGYKSIRYGVMWQYLTPYCHCKEPLRLNHYIFGAIMPAIIMGFIPSVIAITIGSFLWLIFGLIFTLASGGDFLVIWMLRNEEKTSYVQDHPEKVGCFILELAPEEQQQTHYPEEASA